MDIYTGFASACVCRSAFALPGAPVSLHPTLRPIRGPKPMSAVCRRIVKVPPHAFTNTLTLSHTHTSSAEECERQPSRRRPESGFRAHCTLRALLRRSLPATLRQPKNACLLMKNIQKTGGRACTCQCVRVHTSRTRCGVTTMPRVTSRSGACTRQTDDGKHQSVLVRKIHTIHGVTRRRRRRHPARLPCRVRHVVIASSSSF